MAPSVTGKRGPFIIHASTIARAHTYLALSAFLSALVIGCAIHYKKIVKNGVAGYPEEWFPSVSATPVHGDGRIWVFRIGDWYPERNIFQILIAVNAGPRFALVALQYYLHRSASSSIPGFLLLVGLLRTLSCGGWVFITSSDDHDVHDVLMIAYIVLNLPWMFGSLAVTPANHIAARSRRRWTSIAFFASLIPMIYFFIQHKVYRIPGAYSRYSFFEWSLIFLDVLYDSSAELEFQAADLKITIGNIAGGSFETDKIANGPTSSTHTSTSNATVTTVNSSAENVAQPKGKEATKASARRSRYSRVQPTLSFTSDVYLSYVFWSVFTALTPTLFYFSVWELGLSGQELALLSSLSPLFLGIPPFKEWAYTKEGRTVLYLLTLVGLASYLSPSPMARLLLVSFANSAAAISAAAEWFGGDDEGVAYRALVTGLGFLVTSLSKHANHSINPIWPFVNEISGGFNKAGIALALLAIAEFAYRPPIQSEPVKVNPAKAATAPISDTPWLSGAISLGGLIFSLHSLVSDPSTLIAWSWTGYPIMGPIPSQHGSLTHLAQVLGLGLASFLAGSGSYSDILAHPLYLALGSASAYVMYTYKDWFGYSGGLGVAAFLMSLIPVVWARARVAAQSGGVAKTVAVAWLIVGLFDVASVFTVAYAFVPGGKYFRERTNLVLSAQFACIALAFRWPKLNTRPLSLTVSKRAQYTIQYALAVFSALSLLATLYHTPSVVPKPHHPGPRIVRAGIWTVHFGIDNRGRDSQRLMRDLIKDMELDVVGLLETDLHRVTFGNRDLTRVIAEELGFYVDIGPGPNQHTWGAVLLSKFPIINSTHHLLPSPDGELAPAIEAFLDMYGTPVKVIVSHNGQEETPLDRELQAIELARMMSESHPDPVIFLGYVVTEPHALRPAPYQIMVEDGKVFDIDDEDPDRWCEFIFYRGLYRTSYARLSRGIVTDTELQIGQFVVPRYKETIKDTSREARFLRSFKEWLPEEHWFPMEYYPELGGKNGHNYHVFDTPLYYRLPEEAL
ncbi:Frag1/DRAM/Sfk1 family-domain-containing protein [Ganoderma leucocontextum]|nr:Frag1/DRAM/Sfk1 family-domain-containing protein [Ganoderma leucocontextum]